MAGAGAPGWYRDYLDACTRGDWQTVAKFVAERLLVNDEPTARGAYVWNLRSLKRAFPDYAWEIREVLSDGDRLAVLLSATGTHEGVWRGIEPTGSTVTVAELALYRVVDDQITAVWSVADHDVLLAQLAS